MDLDLNSSESSFFSKKNVMSLLMVGIMLLVIPVGVKLLQKTQIFKTRASTNVISFVPGPYLACTDAEGQNCTTSLNMVAVELRSPAGFGLAATPTPPPPAPTWDPRIPTPTLRPGQSPTPLPYGGCYTTCSADDKAKTDRGNRSSNGLVCGDEYCSSSKTCPTPAEYKWYNPNCPTCTDCSSGQSGD